eukprot:322067-Pleurochrysis_carterae.AAC.1
MASSSSSVAAAAAGSTAGSESICSIPPYASSHGQQSSNLTPTDQGRGQPHQTCADFSHTTKQASEVAAGICSSHLPAASVSPASSTACSTSDLQP